MKTDVFSFSLSVNECYIIRNEGTVMIDCGPPGQKENFLKAIRDIGIKAEEIGLIIITHGHPDHIGSAKTIRELTGAKIAMHQLDAECLETGYWKKTNKTGPAKGNAWGWLISRLGSIIASFPDEVEPAKVDLTVTDDGTSLKDYGVPGQIVYTPGHTMGSISILLDSGEVFAGDLAMNRLPLRRGPGLPTLAEDIERVKQSWRHLFELGVTTVYPGHGKPFSIDVMKKALK